MRVHKAPLTSTGSGTIAVAIAIGGLILTSVALVVVFALPFHTYESAMRSIVSDRYASRFNPGFFETLATRARFVAAALLVLGATLYATQAQVGLLLVQVLRGCFSFASHVAQKYRE